MRERFSDLYSDRSADTLTPFDIRTQPHSA